MAIIIMAQATSHADMHHATAEGLQCLSLTLGPRRACAARVTVVVLRVCLFVGIYSRTTGYEAAYEQL